MSCEQEKFCSPRVRGLTVTVVFAAAFGYLFPASTGINRFTTTPDDNAVAVPREYGD